MTSTPRGFCLIINNQRFANPKKFRFRRGSRADAYRLKEVFTQLGFLVHYRPNLTVTEMQTTLLNIARSPQLKWHDALAIIILSHGDTDVIYGTDCLTIGVDYILSLFNNKRCPLLINKPKMFFFSACRGRKQVYKL